MYFGLAITLVYGKSSINIFNGLYWNTHVISIPYNKLFSIACFYMCRNMENETESSNITLTIKNQLSFK